MDDTKCFSIVGTSPDNFDSGWVTYGRRSFLNEVHSGPKPHGRLFTVTGNLAIEQLSLAMRNVQKIGYRPSDHDASFAELYRFLLPTT